MRLRLFEYVPRLVWGTRDGQSQMFPTYTSQATHRFAKLPTCVAQYGPFPYFTFSEMSVCLVAHVFNGFAESLPYVPRLRLLPLQPLHLRCQLGQVSVDRKSFGPGEHQAHEAVLGLVAEPLQ